MSHSQAVQNLGTPAPRDKSAPAHATRGCRRSLPNTAPPALVSVPFHLLGAHPASPPTPAACSAPSSLDGGWGHRGLTAGGLPGRGPGSCRMAWKCNSLSSSGPPGPHRRRNRHSARETLEAGPLVPPLSSCTEHQSSQRGCQTGPVGTPKPHSHQCQRLLETAAPVPQPEQGAGSCYTEGGPWTSCTSWGPREEF